MSTEHVHISCTVPITDLHMYHNSVQGPHVVKNTHVSFCEEKMPALLRLFQVCYCNGPRAILGNGPQGVNHFTTVSVLLPAYWGARNSSRVCVCRYTCREIYFPTTSGTVRLTPFAPFFWTYFVLH